MNEFLLSHDDEIAPRKQKKSQSVRLLPPCSIFPVCFFTSAHKISKNLVDTNTCLISFLLLSQWICGSPDNSNHSNPYASAILFFCTLDTNNTKLGDYVAIVMKEKRENPK